ncbi:unnamed protein product, partial [marine sediment metagenome]
MIAEANNDTQNVKPDDIFGNKYKKELSEYIFKDFIEKFGNSVNIEYRYGEIIDKNAEKIHILTLLRPVVATGILTKEKDIYRFTNQRTPVYTIFQKLISKADKAGNTINAISKLIPLLYELRKDYIIPTLSRHKRELTREYTQKAVAGELKDNSYIGKDIDDAKDNTDQIEEIIKTVVNYNVEHITPVFIYRFRKLFKKDDSGNLVTTIPQDQTKKVFEAIIEAIYDGYVKEKLKGLSSSLTNLVRSQ